MGDFPSTSPAVVVGIDGSQPAVDAALWAADEAVSRDIPLRLVYAIDPDNNSGGDPVDQRERIVNSRLVCTYGEGFTW